ncbi:MAG: hypothetical protein INF79_13075 [Roseomonas sp.]|nr:hypothetical protein [Roseomonas sp.]MCA3327973.1 hypothetical protein [Roseomonas sp.]MCA3332724.1 hypothetical protein [Roseomonas sp.]MCA3334991.1 hypothetical protein [Roseomonas sp.]MCA3346487.1 hypothetical protein [Roseomonas sp.]
MQTNRRVEMAEAAFTCVALLETSAGAELHMRDAQGRLLRLPLRDADHSSHLATLAAFSGPGRPARSRVRSH